MCAFLMKESRMKFVDANKLDRKFGVRFGERGHPSDPPDAAVTEWAPYTMCLRIIGPTSCEGSDV
jgi:hypothetical protein